MCDLKTLNSCILDRWSPGQGLGVDAVRRDRLPLVRYVIEGKIQATDVLRAPSSWEALGHPVPWGMQLPFLALAPPDVCGGIRAAGLLRSGVMGSTAVHASPGCAALLGKRSFGRVC